MRLLLAGGNQRILAEFQEQLRGQDVEVVETATTPDDCLAAARRGAAELAVVHVSIGDYLDLLRRLNDVFPTLATLALAPISGAASLLPLVLQAGAAGLLVEGDTPAATLQTLTRVYAAQQRRLQAILAAYGARTDGLVPGVDTEEDAARGKLVLVGRAKGGSGATFVAANLAALWAMQRLAAPVLVDLALPHGTLPVAINAAPEQRRSIDALISVLAELDRTKIERQLLTGHGGLRVLALPDDADAVDRIGADHITAVLQCFRREFPYTVVDAPLWPRSFLYAAARQADAIVLVSTAELPALAATLRLAGQLRDDLDARPGREAHLVINQVDQYAAMKPKEIEARSGWPPLALLPRNVPLVSALVQQGALVPPAKEPLFQALRGLSLALWERLHAGGPAAVTAPPGPAGAQRASPAGVKAL